VPFKAPARSVDIRVVESGWGLLASAVSIAARVLLTAADWVYTLGRRPGYNWTTGRRSSRVYDATWRLGSALSLGGLVVALGLLIYLIYFLPRG